MYICLIWPYVKYSFSFIAAILLNSKELIKV